MAASPKCTVSITTSPVAAGVKFTARIVDEDVFLTTTDAAIVDRIVSGVTNAQGTLTLDLYRSALMRSPPGGGTRKYRISALALDFDVSVTVPNADTANLHDIIDGP